MTRVSGQITVDDVVTAVEAARGSGALVAYDGEGQLLLLTSEWTFDDSILDGRPLTDGEKSMLKKIVESINQGWTVVVDPSTYPGDPGCLLATDLSILNVLLNEGTEGASYSRMLPQPGFEDGITSLAWGVVFGSLPDGLALDSSTGAISGTPTAAGSFSFGVLVMDGGDPSLKELQWVTIIINPPLVITYPTFLTSSLLAAVMGESYSQTLLAEGGTGSYSWSITAGALPDGLDLAFNPSTSQWEIFGTAPAERPKHKAVTYFFTVTVTDEAGATASQETSITNQPSP